MLRYLVPSFFDELLTTRTVWKYKKAGRGSRTQSAAIRPIAGGWTAPFAKHRDRNTGGSLALRRGGQRSMGSSGLLDAQRLEDRRGARGRPRCGGGPKSDAEAGYQARCSSQDWNQMGSMTRDVTGGRPFTGALLGAPGRSGRVSRTRLRATNS